MAKISSTAAPRSFEGFFALLDEIGPAETDVLDGIKDEPLPDPAIF